jgi:cytidylate kinase
VNEKHTTVTISRQPASGGAYIGRLVARKLGYAYLEREVLHRAARALGVDISELSGQDEKRTGFVDNLLKGFLFGTPEAACLPSSRRPVFDEELFKAESRIIRAIADRQNTVLVGHAGFALLRERTDVFSVFLHAPKEFRAERLKTARGVSIAEALAEIEESDARRERFIKTMTGADWYDARNYHLSLDVRATGLDAAADAIIALAPK